MGKLKMNNSFLKCVNEEIHPFGFYRESSKCRHQLQSYLPVSRY